jgi:hypothetical protein
MTAFFASSSPSLDRELLAAHPEFFRSLKEWPEGFVLLPVSGSSEQISPFHQPRGHIETSQMLILLGISAPSKDDAPQNSQPDHRDGLLRDET